MAFVPLIWTIDLPYGLAAWTYDDMFKGAKQNGTAVYVLDTYHKTRKPSFKYDNVGSQFKGVTVNEDNWSEDKLPGIVTIETDSSNNKYYVQYITDYSTNPITYHVWKTKVYSEDDDPYDWSGSNVVGNYLSFTVGGEIKQSGTVTVETNKDATIDSVAKDWFDASTGYHVDVESITDFTTSWIRETDGSEFFNSRAILGMFGIPYQFMAHVDPRIDYTRAGTSEYLTQHSGTGREYATSIVANMPILFMSPGLPNFMTALNEDDRASVLESLKSAATGGSLFEKQDLFSKSAKYYTFEYKVPEYYTYCNPACRIAAAYMGITDKKIDGKAPDRINWMEYTMKTLRGIFSNIQDATTYMSIPFYIDSDNQINENFSNDTTESSLTSIVDEVSSVGREALFVLGYSNAATNANLGVFKNAADPDAIRESLSNTFDGLIQGNSFFDNLINHISSVATGGRLMFPKIWADSSFGRSYDVTVKLRSPDMDNLSIYCNIIVPFIHLLCFVLPREIDGNPNGFYSPFLVRAIYKGFFNVDMGIITSMSVSKGDSGQWNADGIPCAIDVSFSITDLYENISMTASKPGHLSYDTMDNTCFMDYIANLCGINIYTPEIGRTIRMWFVNNFTNRASDMINIGLWGNIQNSIGNAVTNVWRRSSR